MSEDDRTLWCGNISEKVTEEMLYELFLQAGPVESVKIPRDADRRQRSYSFITYAHACSVEYAMNVFDGTKLFQRTLTLHKKTRNGPNPAGSPQVNFNQPSSSGNRFHDDPKQQHPVNSNAAIVQPIPNNGVDGSNVACGQNNLFGNLGIAFNNSPYMLSHELLAQLGQHLLGADLPPYDDGEQQQSALRTKMQRHDRSQYSDRHRQTPYSRDDRYDRNDSHSRHRHDNNGRRNDKDRQQRSHRRRR